MFNFTKEEKTALLFLIICFLLGIFVSHLKQYHLLDFINFDSELKQTFATGNIDRIIKQVKTVNINTASKEELTFLPGVGPATAEKIIIYRKEHGFYNSPNDLKAIKGIGDKKVEKLKEFVIF